MFNNTCGGQGQPMWGNQFSGYGGDSFGRGIEANKTSIQGAPIPSSQQQGSFGNMLQQAMQRMQQQRMQPQQMQPQQMQQDMQRQQMQQMQPQMNYNPYMGGGYQGGGYQPSMGQFGQMGQMGMGGQYAGGQYSPYSRMMGSIPPWMYGR